MIKTFDSFVIVSFIGIPNAHIEIGIDLLPNTLKSLAKFNEVSKRLLSYFIQTDVLTYIYDSP
jgi:hypothetical protein